MKSFKIGGFEVYIEVFFQARTYGGLIEGLPTKWMNDKILDSLESKFDIIGTGNINEFYAIAPERKKIDTKRPCPFGEPEELPSVKCFARLYSYDDKSFKKRLIGKSNHSMTALKIAWFQDDFGTPGEEVLEQIKNIPWTKVCGEYSD